MQLPAINVVGTGTFIINMVDEINHRVVRGLLGARANTEVKQVEIDIEALTPATSPTSQDHPLMRRGKSE